MTKCPECGIDFDNLEWVEVNVPNIDWDDELKKLHEHIASNPDGYDLDCYGNDGK